MDHDKYIVTLFTSFSLLAKQTTGTNVRVEASRASFRSYCTLEKEIACRYLMLSTVVTLRVWKHERKLEWESDLRKIVIVVSCNVKLKLFFWIR